MPHHHHLHGQEIAETRIPLIKNKHYKRSGIKSYVWLLQKYNITPSQPGPYYREEAAQAQGGYHALAVGGQSKLAALQRRALAASAGANDAAQKGLVSAEDQQNDSEYLSEVSVGTPPQKLLLDFDSGSSDLWCFSTELDASTQSSLKSANHNIFDPSKSTSFKKMDGSKWAISYGDGSSASGIVGTDTLHIGGIDVEMQAIELADTASDSFTSGVGDGLLGLAMPRINTVTPKAVATPVENMITQKDIPATARLFTAYLGSWRDADEADKGESFYTFGYIDQPTLKAAGASEPYYTPLVNQSTRGFWEFASKTATVNGKTIKRENKQSGGNSAIADTGTTLALVDDTLCKAIYAAIPGAKYDEQNQGWTFPSNTKAANLPVVQFAVGDKLFTVQKEDLLFAETEPGTTYGGIQSRGDQTFDILGDTFLKGVYAIFDMGNKRFGAVQRIETTQNLAADPEPSG
ncbi:putative aspartic endopeptidase protein [Venturia nashicola]|uniref:Putative aspartic endopeptidase protein n=1 Tax=Venturia nashicola TaxID=86259 RepID=A0A4Z1P5J2_9PEZI|nr:putative aspartic endopeptidase protein [Venturia nashicola]TLD35744.1 putative aspartic endopeptidase protein [Venturia nashicola]